MPISFENFKKDNAFFKKHIDQNINDVLQLKSEYDHKKYIECFEKDFSSYNDSKYVIAVNSGTAALELALKASGVQKGDEVILPSYSYISTALAITNLGGHPIFVDIKNDTLTIDHKKVKNSITKKTKAIIPVHIHGNPCEMDKIVDIAKRSKLAIVEDCSHAHGAEYNRIKVGNFGIGCFSCHTSKILSGVGSSGLITMNDQKTYDFIKSIITVNNDPSLLLSQRTPCTMDSIQAAILKAKLPYLNKMIKRKRSIAHNYIKFLPKDIVHQKEENKSKHVYRDFVVITQNRDHLVQYLKAKEIATKIRYTTPLHLTQYYENVHTRKNQLQITNNIFKHLLWLPISYVLHNKNTSLICKTIKNYSSLKN